MLEQMVKEAVSHIPVPRDGRDYDPEVLQKAVNDAVANIPQPADGKSLTPDDVRPMLEQMVKEAVRPATPCVTGRYSNRLNYRSTEFFYNHRFYDRLTA